MPRSKSKPKTEKDGLPPPVTEKRERGSRTRLQFEELDKSWKSKLRRLTKRMLIASSPSTSQKTFSSAPASDSGGAMASVEAAKEEIDDWQTEKVVVGGDLLSHGGMTEMEASTHDHSQTAGTQRDPSEFDEDFVGRSGSLQLWDFVLNFFDTRFPEAERERQYQKERWFNLKPLAIVATGFLVVNWIFYLIFNHSVSLYEKVAYYGVATVLTLPVPFLVAFDFPATGKKRYQVFYQVWLMLATWVWGISEVIQTRLCHLYVLDQKNCGNKDFLFMMAYAIGMPTLVLFSCNQKRLYGFIGAVAQFILLCALVLPNQEIFVRNVISFAIFSLIFLYLHYFQEQVDRRLFILRAQLKVSFKAQQKAQIAEKHADNSKRRFISYIFHEVRVPLNSAMLAFQNMQTNGAFAHCESDQAVEIHALEGSMATMKQVLDDVLDLQRMDLGKFESSMKPFPFHRVVQSMLGTLRVAAASKSLKLNIELDESIDEYGVSSESPPEGKVDKDGEGVWVVGDSLRLRQVISNFTSNAVKITPEGTGAITWVSLNLQCPGKTESESSVKTRLISAPSSSSSSTSPSASGSKWKENVVVDNTPSLHSQSRQQPCSDRHAASNSIVVRIEVTDTGPGIRPSEAKRLFEPFVQTKHGVSQALPGSGLGLAIVRQIVTLSGGRLGFHSQKNVGSTFWVEFKYMLATCEQVRGEQESLSSTLWNEDSPPSHSGASFGASDVHVQVPEPPDTLNPPHPPLVKFASAPETSHQQSGSSNLGKPPTTISMTAPVPPLTVLVVDDDPLTRKLMMRTLKKLGAEVEEAGDGQEALDILLGTRSSSSDADGNEAVQPTPRFFDLISLDNAMPILTGKEAVQRLRELGREDFVVGATGNALEPDQIAYLQAGADKVLSKPIMIKDIKAILQTALERRTRTKQRGED